jgi:hypothetical protein
MCIPAEKDKSLGLVQFLTGCPLINIQNFLDMHPLSHIRFTEQEAVISKKQMI